MQKWEYRVLEFWPTQDVLDRLGAEGWELVTIAVFPSDILQYQRVSAYLKRPISN